MNRLRWALLLSALAALLACVAYVAHRRGREERAAEAAEALARVQSTEAALDTLRTETASLAAAREDAEARALEAEAEVVTARAERDRVLAEVRAPMTATARARRVSAALHPIPSTVDQPEETLHATVRPLVLDGVPGMWVEAGAFAVLHEALELRPVLEREIAALGHQVGAITDARDLAVRELAVTQHERDTLRIAWAAAETDLAEARAGPEYSTEAKVIAGVVVAAVAAGAFAVGRATSSGVTVVTP